MIEEQTKSVRRGEVPTAPIGPPNSIPPLIDTPVRFDGRVWQRNCVTKKFKRRRALEHDAHNDGTLQVQKVMWIFMAGHRPVISKDGQTTVTGSRAASAPMRVVAVAVIALRCCAA